MALIGIGQQLRSMIAGEAGARLRELRDQHRISDETLRQFAEELDEREILATSTLRAP